VVTFGRVGALVAFGARVGALVGGWVACGGELGILVGALVAFGARVGALVGGWVAGEGELGILGELEVGATVRKALGATVVGRAGFSVAVGAAVTRAPKI
jgi:hypothetical protein